MAFKNFSSISLCLFLFLSTSWSQDYFRTCDRERNAFLPFCDSNVPINDRVSDLLSRLTLTEKMGMLVHRSAGAVSDMIDLGPYNWWNEALHGVADHDETATRFRPPTEFATVFPQPINLASSFNKELFFQMGNVTGNEARAFYNAGNALLTFWAPNINIYRDPRWGRGHETPGEDPYVNKEYARLFVTGMQGSSDGSGFLKTSACCKHFSAHSLENGRHSFNAIVTEQDMADTYLPAFKTCVEEANVSCIMCAYNAVNGIPACADKGLLTGTIREKWGFDGYVVSDCWAVNDIYFDHHYNVRPEDTCRDTLDDAIDIECGDFFTQYLRSAVDIGVVNERMIDAALSRATRVLMRLGYFEKEANRPYKDLLWLMVDSLPHRALALDAARQSIVLLKNGANAKSGKSILPILKTKTNLASIALIGPHLNATTAFLGNYHGIPSFIKRPFDEIQKHMPDLEFEFGCDLVSFENSRLQEAEDLARATAQVVLMVGIDAYRVEYEEHDRTNLSLPGLQNELIRRVLNVVAEPVIMVVISGGALDLSEWVNDARVGAIIFAGYLGQSGGEAIADVIFGNYNPSGRLAQTFYSNQFVSDVPMGDMNMRPVDGSPGRTYRFFTGQPVYPFGHGLSYTTFTYELTQSGTPDCIANFILTVRNVGQMAGDHSVLWYLSPPNPGQMGRPIKSLANFEKIINILPNSSKQVQLCLTRESFQLANLQGEWQVVTGPWTLMVGNLERIIPVV